jgi:hypothetical protein
MTLGILNFPLLRQWRLALVCASKRGILLSFAIPAKPSPSCLPYPLQLVCKRCSQG